MDQIKIIFKIITKNTLLFSVLVVLSIVAGFIHSKSEKPSYVSNFKTTGGLVDYTLFKSLTEFHAVSTVVYDLPESEIEAISNTLNAFTISFLQETSECISFTAVSKGDIGNHEEMQAAVLRLINNNRFVQTAVNDQINYTKRKLDFLKDKIGLLDSLIANPVANTSITDIPNNSYFLYTEQLELEQELEETGKFKIIKPITDLVSNKRPLIIYLALYLILGGFIFLIFSKKKFETNKS